MKNQNKTKRDVFVAGRWRYGGIWEELAQEQALVGSKLNCQVCATSKYVQISSIDLHKYFKYLTKKWSISFQSTFSEKWKYQRNLAKEWNQVPHSVNHQLQTHPTGPWKSFYQALFTYCLVKWSTLLTLNQATDIPFEQVENSARLSLMTLNSFSAL